MSVQNQIKKLKLNHYSCHIQSLVAWLINIKLILVNQVNLLQYAVFFQCLNTRHDQSYYFLNCSVGFPLAMISNAQKMFSRTYCFFSKFFQNRGGGEGGRGQPNFGKVQKQSRFSKMRRSLHTG